MSNPAGRGPLSVFLGLLSVISNSKISEPLNKVCNLIYNLPGMNPKNPFGINDIDGIKNYITEDKIRKLHTIIINQPPKVKKNYPFSLRLGHFQDGGGKVRYIAIGS